eukprot:TRINITY_DN107520_c0_g1_i1.p1 TRINITY_DN107520_c0_g1~~TRINITY_DN107520_c0_g1_i1.p1  ORF type:complete len:544 (+),score=94.14 TRINITY_DN107520_c0_g1_i1:131-1633(+)
MKCWGWCSWDAYGVQVRPEHLLDVAERCRPPWMVLDDGWQEEVTSEKWREWLHTPQSSPLAHNQFGDLKHLTNKLKPSLLLVWHTLHGYWGGVRPNRGYITKSVRPVWPAALKSACPGEVDVWDGNFSLVTGKADIARYYKEFYAVLADAGIRGVKCDGQFLPELLAGSEEAAAYGRAQEAAAQGAFGKEPPVLHCMGLTLKRIHASGRAAITRVSDDHAYPGVEEDAAAVARHIWHCAANSVWLREIFFCDWDMLRTGEWHGPIHAAARAVAGAPVYVSDLAERFNFDIIQPLLLPSDRSRLVPCTSCGAPIDRQTFIDPTSTSEAWWVVNTTAAGWIAVAFGLRDVGSDLLRSTLLPADLQGGPCASGTPLACLQVELPGLGHAGTFTDAGWDVAVHYMNFTVLAVAPILHVRLVERSIAVFGLHSVWNATGTMETPPRVVEDTVEVRFLCGGELLAWVDGPCTVAVRGGHCVTAKSAGVVKIAVSSGKTVLELENLY